MSRNPKKSTSAGKGRQAGAKYSNRKTNGGNNLSCADIITYDVQLDKNDDLAAIWAVFTDGTRIKAKIIVEDKNRDLCCICRPKPCSDCFAKKPARRAAR